MIPEGKWNTYWVAALFSPVVIWVGMELWSWRKADPAFPTVSRMLVKLFWGWPLTAMTILAMVAALLHWQMVHHDWSLRRLIKRWRK